MGWVLVIVIVCLRGAYVTGEFHYGVWGGVVSCVVALLLPIATLSAWGNAIDDKADSKGVAGAK